MNNRWRAKRKINGSYTFSQKQIWSADITMEKYILAVLKEYYKMKRHGYPGFDEADTPEKWEELVKRFIYTFDQIVNDFPDSPFYIAYDKYCKECPDAIGIACKLSNDGCVEVDDRYTKLKEKYYTEEVKAKEKEYRKYIQDGLQLFAKFFQSIWD